MPENKNSFIKSKMNKDLDDRLIPNNEYRDATNIAVSRSENQDVGAVEAILGNELVFNSSGSLKTIGTYVDHTGGFIYYFLTDFSGTLSENTTSSSTCQICRWSPSSGILTPTVLVEGFFLNFSTESPVHGVNLLENLLFWTDNRNQPRVINVQTASPSGAGVTHYTDEVSISVCKYSPYQAPQLIDLRSISLTKPSTMSDGADIPTILIDALDWATVNLDVTRYRNGDLIEHATTYADWIAADTANRGAWCYYDNDFGNGVTYGKLYNRHAVTDSRGLAPYGFDLPTTANFTALKNYVDPVLGVASLKSTSDWTTTSNISNNRTGFDALPSGERIATSSVVDFQNINTHAEFWIYDELKYFQILDSSADPTIQTVADDKSGRAVRVIKNSSFKGWQGDPELMKDKFIRFSYRFKYEDGEYSLIAPFTQECFIPQQEGKFVNDDEDDTMRSTIVEFMQNNINNVVLNIELPSLDIINDYQIQEIDIIYKESDALSYKVLQNIPVDTVFISNLNNTNIYQYTYQSTIPYKILPTDETIRVYDKVPVRALAQEISGNRVMYGNFIQSYNAPLALDYAVELRDKNNQEYEEYPQHSVKENRNYQVGVILADKYGRQTDVILSSKDNVLVAGGEPIEGSNYFTTYRPVENAGTLAGWQGEQLALRFDSAIPSLGLYALANNYTLDGPYVAPWPAFLNWSTQELTTVAAQTAYTFTNLSYQDTTVFTLYLNEGAGWVLIDASTYGTTDSGDDEIVVTFTSGAPATADWKLLGKNLYNTTQYRYEIDYIPGASVPTSIIGVADLAHSITTQTGDATDGTYNAAAWTTNNDGIDLVINVTVLSHKVTAVAVATPGDKFAVDDTITIGTAVIGGSVAVVVTLTAADMVPGASGIFNAETYLRGKYTDYVEIQTLSQISSINKYFIYTNEEITDTYLFQGDSTVTSNPTTRTEPLTDQDVSNASYNLDNELGFYSYRIVIKQKEQEFYNVYLPGIVDGYPIAGNTTEIGNTAFMVLTHDNINKVPRQLKNVSNQDKQFNSDLLCFGRVTNSETTPGNQQYSPSINADSVELIGGIRDIFPDVEYYDGSNTDKINNNAIFDVTQKPFIAKINTQKSIGLIQTSYNTAAVSGRPDYPAYMRLCAYETAPTVSQLDLFYETSTSGLISDLNYEINSEGTQITGLTSFTWLFNEGDCGGAQITTTFWPTTPAGNEVNALAEITETLVHDSMDAPVLPSLSLFNIVSAGGGGFYLQLKTGAERACLVNFEYLEKYQITIKFTQQDATVSYQTITRTLLNDKPIVELALAAAPEIDDKTILDFVGYQPPGGLDPGPGNGPGVLKGWNGSCNSCERTQDLEWSIESFRYQNTLGEWQTPITGQNPSGTPTETDIEYYMQIDDQAARDQASCSGGSPTNFYGVKVTRNKNTYNSQYETTLQELTMKLTDLNSTGDSETTIVQWTPEGDRLTGVVANYYNNNPAPAAQQWLAPPTGSPGMYPGCETAAGSPVLPTWVGGIANWTDDIIYIYVKIGKITGGSTAISNQTVVWSGENTQNSVSPAKGDGTAALSGSVTINYSGTATTWQLIGSLAAFDPSNQEITEEVVPGDKGTDGLGNDYDWGDCVWINNKIEWTSLNTCDGGAGIAIYYDLVGGGAPVDPKLVQPASGSPPFVTNYWYKSSGWPGA